MYPLAGWRDLSTYMNLVGPPKVNRGGSHREIQSTPMTTIIWDLDPKTRSGSLRSHIECKLGMSG